MRRNLAIGLSIANLSFYIVWSKLLDTSNWVYSDQPYEPVWYAAAIVNVSLLGTIWAGLLMLAELRTNWLTRFLGDIPLVLNMVVVWHLLQTGAVYVLRSSAAGRGEIMLAFAIILLIVWITWPRLVRKTSTASGLILFPFVLVTVAQTVRLLATPPPPEVFADAPLAAPLPPKPDAPRVVWMIFDELDQSVTFDQRPASVFLPEFDRFRDQAIYASNAAAAAGETLVSMPALTTGLPVHAVKPSSPRELSLEVAGKTDRLPWSKTPTVFSEAREMGFNSAIVAAFLPYCKMLGAVLTYCSWQKTPEWTGSVPNMSFLDMVTLQIRSVVEWFPIGGLLLVNKLPFSEFWRVRRVTHLSTYHTRMADAEKLVKDPIVNLLLVHFPVPHPPAIYDRSRDEVTTEAGHNYFDNLELADRALGEIRRAMEDAGMWDRSAVLVSADHWWRTEMWRRDSFWTEEEAPFARKTDRRIPFMLKLPGQNSAIAYDPPINALLTHDLLLALLREELSTPEGVVRWLGERGSKTDKTVPAH
jgi:hypothetical protein